MGVCARMKKRTGDHYTKPTHTDQNIVFKLTRNERDSIG